jgi:hypothetical protein
LGTVGIDFDSAPIWQDYIQHLKEQKVRILVLNVPNFYLLAIQMISATARLKRQREMTSSEKFTIEQLQFQSTTSSKSGKITINLRIQLISFRCVNSF